jgi:hypothetical protein
MRTGRESPVLQDTLLHRETFIVTPTQVGPMFRELQRFGCPPRRLGRDRDVPTISRTGLSPARDTAPQRGAHSNPCFSLEDCNPDCSDADLRHGCDRGCHDAFEFEWFVTEVVQSLSQ